MTNPVDSIDTKALYLLGFSPSLSRESDTESHPRSDRLDAKLDSQTITLLNLLGIKQIETPAVWAWYKEIERTEFEGPEAEKNLANLQWLTPRVLAHETVVDKLSFRWAFYPARFGTLFSSHCKLKKFATSQTETLIHFFAQIRGKSEWGIKFLGDLARAAEIMAARNGLLQDSKPTSGANYLKLRQLQRVSTNATRALLDESYQIAYQSLKQRFSNIVSRSLRSVEGASTQEVLLGSLAILSNESTSNELSDWVIQWNTRQTFDTALRAELTGPWPAYSFCPSLSSLQTEEVFSDA